MRKCQNLKSLIIIVIRKDLNYKQLLKIFKKKLKNNIDQFIFITIFIFLIMKLKVTLQYSDNRITNIMFY